MTKDPFVIELPEELDKEFRRIVEKQGKQYNLSLEEAIKFWLEENKN